PHSAIARRQSPPALAGRDIIVLQDNDTTGRKKALAAATALHGVAKTIRVVLLPNLPDGGDVSDWLDVDPRRTGQLVDVCFDAPLWKPTGDEPNADADDEQDTTSSLPFINMQNWDDEPVPPQ